VSEATRQVAQFFNNRAQEQKVLEKALSDALVPNSGADAAQVNTLLDQLESAQQWSATGKYGQVMLAVTGAAAGNVVGSSGAFMQAAAVNYLQGLGAGAVKQIADQLGQGPESEAARTALHSIVGCAGAAASNAACSAGALGAGAGSILNSLMGPSTELTPQQAEARRNTVSSLVAGIASSAGMSAATASTAATLETTNNAVVLPFIPALSAAATAATAKCASHAGCQRAVMHVADKTIYVAVQMKDALYVGSAALVGMVAASDTVGDWVSNFVGEVVSGTTLPGKPGEVVHVVTTPPLPAAQDRFGAEIPVWPGEPIGPMAVPGQDNKGPATGMTTETPLLEPQGPGLIFSQGEDATNSVIAPNPGKTTVYVSTLEDGTTKYVGITDNIDTRSAAHLSQKGIEIDSIPGLQGISRDDARAVEQVLIEYNGLGKNGGSLLNKINSIASTNPIYANSLSRGVAILKSIGYPGFK